MKWPRYESGKKINVGDVVRCRALPDKLGRIECISFNGASAACIHVNLGAGLSVDTTAAGLEEA